MNASRYDAILFDFDGVLIDSEPVHLACWMEVLEPLGIRCDWDTYRQRYIGVDDRLMLASLCQEAHPPVPFEEAWAQYPRKKQLFERRMQGDEIVSPEVRQLLERLHRAFKLAVVTSSARSEVEPILARAGLLPLLGTAVYGGDAARHKPAPDPYLLAAERLHARRPLVVEDSAAGVASARAAGFDVLHIPSQREMVKLLEQTLTGSDKHGQTP